MANDDREEKQTADQYVQELHFRADNAGADEPVTAKHLYRAVAVLLAGVTAAMREPVELDDEKCPECGGYHDAD